MLCGSAIQCSALISAPLGRVFRISFYFVSALLKHPEFTAFPENKIFKLKVSTTV